MVAFNPKAWAKRFEAAGGIVGYTTDLQGPHLWTGVIVRRPDRGARARRILSELDAHPEWHDPLTAFARERLGRSCDLGGVLADGYPRCLG